MHGLPTEKATEKVLGISGGKEEILKKFGSDVFVEKCREVCVGNLKEMNKTFASLGKAASNSTSTDTLHRNMDGL